jgi:hypothetical protein
VGLFDISPEFLAENLPRVEEQSLLEYERDNLHETEVRVYKMEGESPTFESRNVAPWSKAIGIDRAMTSKMKARWHRAGPALIWSSEIGPPSFVITNMGCEVGQETRIHRRGRRTLPGDQVDTVSTLGPPDRRSRTPQTHLSGVP